MHCSCATTPTPCLPGRSWLVPAENVAGPNPQTWVEGWRLWNLCLGEHHLHSWTMPTLKNIYNEKKDWLAIKCAEGGAWPQWSFTCEVIFTLTRWHFRLLLFGDVFGDPFLLLIHHGRLISAIKAVTLLYGKKCLVILILLSLFYMLGQQADVEMNQCCPLLFCWQITNQYSWESYTKLFFFKFLYFTSRWGTGGVVAG